MLELIGEFRDHIGLLGWDVWHGERISRYLDNFPDIRQTYTGFVTPGDVLANLREVLGSQEPIDFTAILSVHAAKEMLAQRYIRLTEAGGAGTDRLSLGSVAIDLPAQSADGVNAGQAGDEPQSGKSNRPGIVAEIVRNGDTVHSSRAERPQEPHIIVIGGPGQGKSTIGQLVCQVYRVALLRHRPVNNIGPQAADYLQSLAADIGELRIPFPRSLRWPILVELAKYGDELARGRGGSLLQYLSSTMSIRTEITSQQLKIWLGRWPWLIVLDGLDEVAEPAVREKVMERVSEFLIDAASVHADVLVVATTRPQGYGQEFPEPYYQRWYLAPLDRGWALTYARRLAHARHQHDPDFRRRIIDRLINAAREPATERLMRTPLQVTIMSLLLERRSRVPQDRYGLFDSYYNTLYDRETNKDTPTALLLRQNRRHIDFLHEKVGLLLQVRAERAGRAESLLRLEELKSLLLGRLHDEGFSEAETAGLADELISAATERLVMLAAMKAGHVGFEIRSLQELMAARALSSGPDDEVMQRLQILAPSAHWRNTWLFIASRLFAERERVRDRVVNLLNVLDTESRFAMFVASGTRLALELLDEDAASQAPIFQRVLAEKALGAIEFAPNHEVVRLGRVLRHVTKTDPQAKAVVERKIDRAIDTRGYPALSALQVLHEWHRPSHPDAESGTPFNEARYRALHGSSFNSVELSAAVDRLFKTKMSHNVKNRRVPAGQMSLFGSPALSQEIRRRRFAPAVRSALDEIARHLSDQQLEALTPLLNAKMRDKVVELIETLPLPTWQEAAYLRDIMVAWREQQAISLKDLEKVLRHTGVAL